MTPSPHGMRAWRGIIGQLGGTLQQTRYPSGEVRLTVRLHGHLNALASVHVDDQSQSRRRRWCATVHRPAARVATCV